MAARIQDVHRDEPPCGDSVPGKQGRGLEIEREGGNKSKKEREREGERGPRSTTREGRKATDPPIQAMKKMLREQEGLREMNRGSDLHTIRYYHLTAGFASGWLASMQMHLKVHVVIHGPVQFISNTEDSAGRSQNRS